MRLNCPPSTPKGSFPTLLAFKRAVSAAAGLDYLPITVDGWLGRIDAWTHEEWESLPPDRRPQSARLVKGLWLSPRML
jgi:hypothetical protein